MPEKPPVNTIRAFIAVSLPAQITRRLDSVLQDLKARLPGNPVRWVPARNIHLTLKFLGDTPAARLEAIQAALSSAASQHSPFEVSVGELGAFPSVHRPRVVWMGVEAPPGLAALQRSIDQGMKQLGFPTEDRPFSPHLTLGRVSRNAGPNDARLLGEILERSKIETLGSLTIQAIHLYRSELAPGGSIYTGLYSAALKQTADHEPHNHVNNH